MNGRITSIPQLSACFRQHIHPRPIATCSIALLSAVLRSKMTNLCRSLDACGSRVNQRHLQQEREQRREGAAYHEALPNVRKGPPHAL